MMDVVVIYNGLGNQMSQYAFYLSKKLRGQRASFVSFNTDHNGYELDKLFNIRGENKFYRIIYLIFWLKRWNRVSRFVLFFLKKLGVNIFSEDSNYSFRSVALAPASGITFFLGGWHNPLYFDDFKNSIKKQFEFPGIYDEYNNSIIDAARQMNAVAIHVRGGDYLKGDFYNTYGAVCNGSYYRKAMAHVESMIEHPTYYVFTNDVKLSNNIFRGKDITIININKGDNAWKDMAIMSRFHTIIISNSTFSWWAAYLGEEGKTVICPPYLQKGNTTSDIFPSEWIRIDNSMDNNTNPAI